MISVREAVSRELERLRVADEIGSSLDAEVDLYCDDDLYNELARLEDELRFVLITSYARIHPLDRRPADAVGANLGAQDIVWIKVIPSRFHKCIRCWHHREDVGSHAEHPQLCGRCVENISGSGEIRKYA